jgi:hypothetical protein
MKMKMIDWSKSHNGVILCTLDETLKLMPEVEPVLTELIDSGELEFDINDYLIDVKVHMLMPEQYPCIPNWHCDFVPRDEELKLRPDLITGEKMYLWVSGEPKTEFRETPERVKTENYEWVVFTQRDSHRGKLRRHSQVYLDANTFNW